MQTRPRAQRSMKLIASGVTHSAASGQVAFVLAVFVVDDEDHLAAPDPSERVVDSGQRHLNVLRRWVGITSKYGVALDARLRSNVDTARKGHDHAAAVRFDRLDADVAVVQVDDPARDREPETRAAVVGGARAVGAVEAFEHARRLGVGDARVLRR